MKSSISKILVLSLAASMLFVGCGSAQSRKASYLQHGKDLFAAGNYEKARVELRNAGQIDPKDGEVRYWLGQVAEKMGDIREAVGNYRAAIDYSPKLTAPRAALGRLYLYGGLAANALEIVEPGLTLEPRNAQLITVRGAARQQLGDPKSALADAELAVSLAPNDSYALALLSSLYRAGGQDDKAIEVIQQGIARLPKDIDLRVILADLYLQSKQPDKAEATLKEVVALDPKTPMQRYRLARFYLIQKNPTAAEQTLRDAVAAIPDNVEAKLQLVQLIGSQHGAQQAGAEVDQLIAKDQDNDNLKLALGQYLAQAGVGDKAETLFKSVIAHADTKPAGLSARDRLAALLLSRGDNAGASTLVAQVLKENQRDNDALILRSNMALASGNASAAITDLRAVLRDQPNALPVMRQLARAYSTNNEPDLAERTLRSAVQIAPKDVDSRLQLAQVLQAQGKSDQAAPMLEQLAKEAPQNVAVQETLFQVQASQKQYDKARATATEIQQTNPGQPMGYYLAGLVDEAQGKTQDALQDYDQALKAQPLAAEPLTAWVRLQLKLKQPQAAMQRVDAVIAQAPKDAQARTLKAELLLAANQNEAAINCYQDAIGVAPTWPAPYQSLARVQLALKHNDEALRTLQLGVAQTHGAPVLDIDLANLYLALGRTDDAVAVYDTVLKQDPNATFAINELALMLVNHRSDAASLARAQKLADQLQNAGGANFVDTRGWVKFKTGDARGAETLLQQASAKLPDSAQARYHLAAAQIQNGESQSGLQNLQTAVQSGQNFPEINEARAQLAKLAPASKN